MIQPAEITGYFENRRKLPPNPPPAGVRASGDGRGDSSVIGTLPSLRCLHRHCGIDTTHPSVNDVVLPPLGVVLREGTTRASGVLRLMAVSHRSTALHPGDSCRQRHRLLASGPMTNPPYRKFQELSAIRNRWSVPPFGTPLPACNSN